MGEAIQEINHAKLQKNILFHDLIGKVSATDWSDQVSVIASAMKLPITDRLLRKETAIPVHSDAGILGHKNVYGFITSSSSEDGLGFKWEDWLQSNEALHLQNFYAVFGESPEDVISEVSDVSVLLGRQPVDAKEFHTIKTKHLIKQKSEMQKRFSVQKATMTLEIDSISRENKRLTSELRRSEERYLESENGKMIETLKSQLQDSDCKLGESESLLKREKQTSVKLKDYTDRFMTKTNTQKDLIEELRAKILLGKQCQGELLVKLEKLRRNQKIERSLFAISAVSLLALSIVW
jgi:H2-forming N5,N10-methylenetetrahydromethanopterin dehydrogenase-like enzyme